MGRDMVCHCTFHDLEYVLDFWIPARHVRSLEVFTVIPASKKLEKEKKNKRLRYVREMMS